MNSWISCGDLLDDFGSFVVRCIVANNDLQILPSLSQGAFDRSRQESGAAIGRYENSNIRRGRIIFGNVQSLAKVFFDSISLFFAAVKGKNG